MHGSLLDFSSWSSMLSTVASLLLITLLMVGIRLLLMQTLQKRRERENRQINERLKTLIAAYKTLGGSFTGQLQVSPMHLRDWRSLQAVSSAEGDSPPLDAPDDGNAEQHGPSAAAFSSERQRRTRDAVEAALSDVILLGTETQVRLAAQAAQHMVAGQSVETAALVASLRDFIRTALDLEPIPADIAVPNQGPTRTGAGSGAAKSRASGGSGAGANTAGGGRGAGGGGGAGGGTGGAGLGMGAGMGLGGLRRTEGTEPD